MKKISVVSSSELIPTSAVDVVLSNDDLLIEILLRIPVSSLVVFKFVSKRWLTLITNPNFILRRIPLIDPPSGLIFFTSDGYKLVSLDNRIPSPTTTFRLPLDSYNVGIGTLQSCNGLILCRSMFDDHELCVYNPSTNRFKTIPKPPPRKSYHNATHEYFSYNVGGFMMAFNPSKSPHYKIVYAESTIDHIHRVIQVHIYSSETCNWSVCGDRFLDFPRFKGFSQGIYWNGGIHWLNDHELKLYMLDVEHPVLKSIPTPRKSTGDCRTLFESNGCLLLLCVGPFGLPSLSIYKMSKECISSWSLVVTLDDIRVKYQLQTGRWKPSEWFFPRVQCIVIEKKEDDSFLVMKIDGAIIKYKMVSNTISKIYEPQAGSIYSASSFEFIASFADV